MRTFDRLADLASFEGREIGASGWVSVAQSRIDLFAQATGDAQWIHVDAARAAAGPFGATVAHGFLTLSLLSELSAAAFRIADVRMGLNYGLNRVRFPAPVRVGSRIRSHTTVMGLERLDDGVQFSYLIRVEIEGSEKPACVAEFLARVYP